MPAGAERDALLRHRGIGPLIEVELAQARDVDQDLARGGLSSQWMCHAGNLLRQKTPDSATAGPCAAMDNALPRRCNSGNATPHAAPMAAPVNTSVK